MSHEDSIPRNFSDSILAKAWNSFVHFRSEFAGILPSSLRLQIVAQNVNGFSDVRLFQRSLIVAYAVC